MAGKRSKWATHLKKAEASGLSLAAYAQKHRIDVHRLYEARQLRKLQATTAWSVVHVKPAQIVEAASCVAHRGAPTTLAMQARLGNGVMLSWAQDLGNTAALNAVLHTLASVPCSI